MWIDEAAAFIDGKTTPRQPTHYRPKTPEQIAVEGYIAQNVRDGLMEEAGRNDSGDMTYRLTEAGQAKADELMGGSDG